MKIPRRIKIKDRPNPDKVLVVGSVAYDSISTPHSFGEKILGGSASYACLAASYFTILKSWAWSDMIFVSAIVKN
jgi:hypothetical protein